MEDFSTLFGLLFNCGTPIVLLLLGLIVGRTIERSHFKKLERMEAALLTIPVNDLRSIPPGMTAGGATLVTGSVVVASDYLKTFLASLRKIIGGEVRSFERLMERARREALCRLLAEAHEMGASAVINVRLETSNIGAMRRKRISPMVEVIAYGTALVPPGKGAQALDVTLPCPSCGYALIGIDELGCPECGWNRAAPPAPPAPPASPSPQE